MVNAIVASIALFGASVSASVGKAHVVNKCSYDVYMCETPADGGGYSTQDVTLQPGDTWDQQWTQLTNGAGWSIKLSHDEGSFGSNILQYEYTFQNDGTIWYDLSCVDGNPWDGNWEITSNTDQCSPKQQAYRYATDDAYGMQSCSQDASITVTLCSGEASDNSTSPDSYSFGSESSASAVAPSTYVAPEATAYTPSPTTFATQTTAAIAYNLGAVTITEIVTEIATATQYAKRHQHHPRGDHQHHHA